MPTNTKTQIKSLQKMRDKLAEILRDPEHDKGVANMLRDRIKEMTKAENEEGLVGDLMKQKKRLGKLNPNK